uniref:NADH-ubiquinone oxidoreductase chain 3 n=1 Tax=Yininemertes pratensis TaxID=2057967 RepID=A0A7U3VJZ0_9BILA|nr:NADH dehydrogenase subunit 3 [Yininemertes pratensis]QQP01067.1 NADH dehydrogenase subunit 3 [Yininemertes pratensis]
MVLINSGVVLSVFVSSAVCLTAWLLAKRAEKDREKSSPFECGFDPKLSARVPFSVRFFLLAVIFLIFDVEIALLLPVPFVVVVSYSVVSLVAVGLFLGVLAIGLLHEWREGSLEWVEMMEEKAGKS